MARHRAAPAQLRLRGGRQTADHMAQARCPAPPMLNMRTPPCARLPPPPLCLAGPASTALAAAAAQQRRGMFIQTQPTPNPQSLMFVPGQRVMEVRHAEGWRCWCCMLGPLRPGPARRGFKRSRAHAGCAAKLCALALACTCVTSQRHATVPGQSVPCGCAWLNVMLRASCRSLRSRPSPSQTFFERLGALASRAQTC